MTHSHNVDVSIAQRLTTVIRDLKISRAALARRLEISPQNLSGILQGHQNLTVGIARKLAEGAGIDLNWLICGQVRGEALADAGSAAVVTRDLSDEALLSEVRRRMMRGPIERAAPMTPETQCGGDSDGESGRSRKAAEPDPEDYQAGDLDSGGGADPLDGD